MAVTETTPETINNKGGALVTGLNQKHYIIKGMTHRIGLHLVSN